jgi:hypothetical protein
VTNWRHACYPEDHYASRGQLKFFTETNRGARPPGGQHRLIRYQVRPRPITGPGLSVITSNYHRALIRPVGLAARFTGSSTNPVNLVRQGDEEYPRWDTEVIFAGVNL